MASKNSVKVYLPDSYYHIYNRGVDKRTIFTDPQDYSVFLSYLQTYLSPKDTNRLYSAISSPSSTPSEKEQARKLLHLKNYSQEIDLVCYALLPNHFHLLIHQKSNLMSHFMNSLCTRYVMYFNRKHKRTGVLFQDINKAVLVNSEEQLLHLSRYIHLNPIPFSPSLDLPSSLPEFLSRRQTSWIKPQHILPYFSKTSPTDSYLNFVNSSQDESIVYEISLD